MNSVRKLFDYTLSVPAYLTFLMLEHPRMENFLYESYQRYVNHHKNHLPKLSPVEENIVQDLKRTGVYITTLAELDHPNTDHFYSSSLNLFKDLRKEIKDLRKEKDSSITSNSSHVHPYPATFTWGLQSEILRLVTAYLETPPGYDGVSYNLSQPDSLEEGARLWHRDREDRKMLKIIVYFSDVDDASGPFQMLTPEYSNALSDLVSQNRQRRYRCFTHRQLQQIFPDVEKNGLVNCTGKAGTVIFVDTARLYHRGKPPSQGNRQAAFLSYFSQHPWHPFFCERGGFSQRDLEVLTEGYTDQQKACVFWKQDLPRIARYIPRYRR